MGTEPGPTTPAPPPPPPSGGPRERKWIPTIAVFLVLAFVTLGGFFIGGGARPAIGEPEPPQVPPITVVPGVTIRPVEGWTLTQQATEPQGVRLARGDAHLDVFVFTGGGSPESLLEFYVNQYVLPQAFELQIQQPPDSGQANGIPAVRAAYLGSFQGVQTPIEGEISAAVSGSTGVIFDGWAPEGQFGLARDEVRVMVQTVEVSA